ncbi:hypothetical protein HPB50_005842 [Hyalomma asiaticum]|uniref:Uncharacterized protein n=1 Tax=Hyalomma asiaticum TaxID=266040 RepID=A0ACB7S4U6_HYAAI|nr:hypothetical protein HPB50_005842 [Hyalomma asiaticum]
MQLVLCYAPPQVLGARKATENVKHESPKRASLSPPVQSSQGVTEVIVHQQATQDMDDDEPVQVKYEVVEEVVAYETCPATVMAGQVADEDQMDNDTADNNVQSPTLVPAIVAVEDEDAATTPSGSPELAELRVEWPVSPSQAAVVVSGAHQEGLQEMYVLDPLAQPTPEQLAVVGTAGPDHVPCDYRMMTLNHGSPGPHGEFQELPPPHHHPQAQPYLLASPDGSYSVRILSDDGQPLPQTQQPHLKLVKGSVGRGAAVVVDAGSGNSEVVHGEVFLPSTVDIVPRTTAYGHHAGVITAAAPVTAVLPPTAAATATGTTFISRDVSYALPQQQPQQHHQRQQTPTTAHQPAPQQPQAPQTQPQQTHQSRGTRSSGRTRDRTPIPTNTLCQQSLSRDNARASALYSRRHLSPQPTVSPAYTFPTAIRIEAAAAAPLGRLLRYLAGETTLPPSNPARQPNLVVPMVVAQSSRKASRGPAAGRRSRRRTVARLRKEKKHCTQELRHAHGTVSCR